MKKRLEGEGKKFLDDYHKQDLIEDITSEIEKIEKLFQGYTLLLNKVITENPNSIEVNALGMLLHYFL